LEDLGEDNIKMDFKGGSMWIGFVRFRIRTSGGNKSSVSVIGGKF